MGGGNPGPVAGGGSASRDLQDRDGIRLILARLKNRKPCCRASGRMSATPAPNSGTGCGRPRTGPWKSCAVPNRARASVGPQTRWMPGCLVVHRFGDVGQVVEFDRIQEQDHPFRPCIAAHLAGRGQSERCVHSILCPEPLPQSPTSGNQPMSAFGSLLGSSSPTTANRRLQLRRTNGARLQGGKTRIREGIHYLDFGRDDRGSPRGQQ